MGKKRGEEVIKSGCTAVMGRFNFGEQTCGDSAIISRFKVFPDDDIYEYACAEHDPGHENLFDYQKVEK